MHGSPRQQPFARPSREPSQLRIGGLKLAPVTVCLLGVIADQLIGLVPLLQPGGMAFVKIGPVSPW